MNKVLLKSLQLELIENIKPDTTPKIIKDKMKKKKEHVNAKLNQLTRNQVVFQQSEENNATVNQVTNINQVTQTEDNETLKQLTRKQVECQQCGENDKITNQVKSVMKNKETVRNNLNSKKHNSEIIDISHKKQRTIDFANSIITEFDKYYDPNKRIDVDLNVNDDNSGKS